MRWLRRLLTAVTALAAVALAVWLALPWLIESIGPSLLRSAGLRQGTYTVAEIDGAHVVLTDVRLGEAVSVPRATLDLSLFPPSLSTLTLDRPWVHAVLGSQGLRLPGLESLTEGSGRNGSGGGASLPVDRLIIRQGRLSLDTPGGSLTAEIDADLGLGMPFPWGLGGTASATVTARNLTVPGMASGIDGGGHIVLQDTEQGFIITATEPLAITVSQILTGGMPLAAPLTVVARGPASDPLSLRVDRSEADGETLINATAQAAVEVSGANGQKLAAAGNGGFTMTPDGVVRGIHIGDLTLNATALATPAGTIDGALTIADLDGLPLSASMRYAVDATLSDLSLDPLTAPQASLTSRGRLDWSGFAVLLHVEDGTLSLGPGTTATGIEFPDGLTLPFRAAADGPTLEAALGPEGSVTLVPHVAVHDATVTARRDGEPVTASIAKAMIDGVMVVPASPADHLTVTLDGARLDHAGVSVSGVSGTLSSRGGTAEAHLTARLDRLPGEDGPLSDPVKALRPFAVSLDATDDGSGPWSFSALLRDASGRRLMLADGSHDLGTGAGNAWISVPALRFESGGLQPGALYQGIGDQVTADGTIAAKGAVTWNDKGLKPSIEVAVKDATISRGFVQLRRLNSVLKLTNLWPPRTPPDQTAAVAAVEAGLLFTDALATFRLDGTGAVLLDHATMRLAGGTIEAGPAKVPLDLDQARLDLVVQGVRLADLVDIAEVQGLRATGTLSGRIPIVIDDGLVIVDHGRLTTRGGGQLRYAPDEPPAALASAGQSVDLLMKALENFQYKDLDLTLNGKADGELEVALHLTGANPDLYDGYPVELNLTLSGALSQVIRQSLTGYRVPDRIRERLSEFPLTQ